MKTEDLIASLTHDLRPVRRVRSPELATTLWLAGAALAMCVAVVYFGPREDIGARLASGADLPQMLAAVATGALAAFAAFQRALPDRGWQWGLLPVPAIAVWLATLGWGCLREVTASGPEALYLSTSWQCIGFISASSIPLGAGMLWLSRHAAPLRPVPVAALGGLAAAALASAGLTCVHDLNAAAMVLVWHGMAVALVTAAASLVGPRIMRSRMLSH